MKVNDGIGKLKEQVKWLLGAGFNDADFVKWLGKLTAKGNLILNPPSIPVAVEASQRRALRQFQSDQAVVDWAHAHGLVLGKKEFWWWCDNDGRQGYIIGLEQESVGLPMITNGIDVWIERANGELFKGHRDWLKYYRKPRSGGNSGNGSTAVAKKVATDKDLEYAQRIIDGDAVGVFAKRYKESTGKDLPEFSSKESTFEQDVQELAYLVHEHFQAIFDQSLAL